MKPIEFSFPYFDAFRPIKRKKREIPHPFAIALSEFHWRMMQARMFLHEIERHTGKMDKRITMKIFGHEFQIPAVAVNASTKEGLARNRREVERMISDSMIIILISVIEYSLRDLCVALKTSRALRLAWNELRGEPLNRFKTYFEKVGALEIAIADEDWELLKAIDRLRNTIAHSMGEIRGEDKSMLDRLSKKYPSLKIIDGCAVPSLGFVHEIIDKVSIVFGQSIGKLAQPELEDIMRRAKLSR
jgi:hypothetical protein